MKLDEAIKALKTDLLQPGSVNKLDFQDAEQLGIEALERVRSQRKFKLSYHLKLLPGETPPAE